MDKAGEEKFMQYDPWSKITSRNGIPCDELISMLQKSIRKAKVENALAAAYELYVSSPQLLEKLWRRLLIISVEDIGFGDVEAPQKVYTLFKIAKEFPYDDGDQPLLFMQAIRILCRCTKERSTDNIKNWIIKTWKHGYKVEVPDYALDMHTQRGQAMGRDEMFFLTDASVVTPELDDESVQRIKKAYIEFCKEDELDDTVPETPAFRYNGWQS